MTIDWMNPSDDILEARRVGYGEGLAEAEAREEEHRFDNFKGPGKIIPPPKDVKAPTGLRPGTACGGGDWTEEVMACGCLPSDLCDCPRNKGIEINEDECSPACETVAELHGKLDESELSRKEANDRAEAFRNSALRLRDKLDAAETLLAKNEGRAKVIIDDALASTLSATQEQVSVLKSRLNAVGAWAKTQIEFDKYPGAFRAGYQYAQQMLIQSGILGEETTMKEGKERLGGLKPSPTDTPLLETCKTCSGYGVEICDNPDHEIGYNVIQFTKMIPARFRCPACGYDEYHRIPGTVCPDCNGTGVRCYPDEECAE